MNRQQIQQLHQAFEGKAREAAGVEFWYARELAELLGYQKWENFYKGVVEKARTACANAGVNAADHFQEVSLEVKMPRGGFKQIPDWILSRYASYLIAQNADPRKEAVAFAMHYFAEQTRKMEVIELRLAAHERLEARRKLDLSDKELAELLFQRGIDRNGIAKIREKGNQALFGGLPTHALKAHLQVPEERSIDDFLPTISIKAKDFANEITAFTVRKQETLHEKEIGHEHEQNNSSIRKLLLEKGIKPEDLPPEEDITLLAKRLQKADQELLEKTIRQHTEKKDEM